MIHPVLGITVIIFLLIGLLFVLHRVQIKWHPHPELIRKSLHMGMGSVTLTFPWLFQEVWAVVTVSSISAIILLVVRYHKTLQNNVGRVLSDVARNSWGELSFAAGVAILFIIANGNALIYCLPMLLLTFADTLAALVGIHIGKTTFKTLDGKKSIEGCVAFFIAALLFAYFLMDLFSNIAAEKLIIIVFLWSLWMTAIEAVAWKGLDNLFIPVFGGLLLERYALLSNTTLTWIFMATLVTMLAILVSIITKKSLCHGKDCYLVLAGVTIYTTIQIGAVS